MPKILYVDDEQKNLAEIPPQLIASAKRRRTDLTVDTAFGTAAADELVAKNKYDAIVIDYDMPKAPGYDNGVRYAQVLRESGVTAPMILFTRAWLQDIKTLHKNFGSLDLHYVGNKDAGMAYNALHHLMLNNNPAFAGKKENERQLGI